MLKRIEKIIRESAFDKTKKKTGLKFNPGLGLTGVRTTGPRFFKYLGKKVLFTLQTARPLRSSPDEPRKMEVPPLAGKAKKGSQLLILLRFKIL